MKLKLDFKIISPLNILLITSLTVAALCMVFAGPFRFYRQIKIASKELNETKTYIKYIHDIVGGEEKISEAIETQGKRLKSLELKLPKDENSSLRMLAGEAKKLDVEVISVKPSKARFFDGADIPAEMYVQYIPVSIKLKGPYKQIGEYFDHLRKNYYSLVILRKVVMEALRSENEYLLSAAIEAEIYTASTVERAGQ